MSGVTSASIHAPNEAHTGIVFAVHRRIRNPRAEARARSTEERHEEDGDDRDGLRGR